MNMRNARVVGAWLLLYANIATAADPFSGEWAHYSCEWRHSVHLKIVVSGNDVTGDWADGTIRSVWGGKLSGTIRDGRLVVRRCTDDGPDHQGMSWCPEYERTADILKPVGKNMVWYTEGPTGKKKYLTLKPYSRAREEAFWKKCGQW
jgi:hypothetical protein